MFFMKYIDFRGKRHEAIQYLFPQVFLQTCPS
jgi:hypothetical protein